MLLNIGQTDTSQLIGGKKHITNVKNQNKSYNSQTIPLNKITLDKKDSACEHGCIRTVLLAEGKERLISLLSRSTQMNIVLLCSLCSDRRGRELHHWTTIRPKPESRLSGDIGLREQPGGEDGGDVLCESQLLMN